VVLRVQPAEALRFTVIPSGLVTLSMPVIFMVTENEMSPDSAE
jgi:hypothetical protein